MRKVLSDDSLIPDEILSRRFTTISLHVAISRNQAEFVKELLSFDIGLAEVLESGSSPLHLAAAKGDVEIARALVKASKKMCFVRDSHGMNPVHVAAMEGKEEVLKELVEACPQAARMKLDRDETILHLCVKHEQLGTLLLLLQMGVVSELINAMDSCGNTILHLAVSGQDPEIVRHVVNCDQLGSNVDREKQKLDVNAVNAQGHTALDIALFMGNVSYKDYLVDVNCKRNTIQRNWISGKRETLMLVASLIATMAFQAAVTPPSGIWQETSDGHRAGESVLANTSPNTFIFFVYVSTSTFYSSLIMIFLLLITGTPSKSSIPEWALVSSMWFTITYIMITFVFYIMAITPEEDRVSVKLVLSNFIVCGISMTGYFTIYTHSVFKRRQQGIRKFIRSVCNGSEDQLLGPIQFLERFIG